MPSEVMDKRGASSLASSFFSNEICYPTEVIALHCLNFTVGL